MQQNSYQNGLWSLLLSELNNRKSILAAIFYMYHHATPDLYFRCTYEFHALSLQPSKTFIDTSYLETKPKESSALELTRFLRFKNELDILQVKTNIAFVAGSKYFLSLK